MQRLVEDERKKPPVNEAAFWRFRRGTKQNNNLNRVRLLLCLVLLLQVIMKWSPLTSELKLLEE